MDILHVFKQDNIVLILVFLLLISMSIASWSIIFRKIMLMKFERGVISNFRAKYCNSPAGILSSLKDSQESCIKDIMFELHTIEDTIKALNKDERKDVISMHLVQTLDRIKVKLDSGLTTLASIASAAPFIGLFGTVWGIYGALLDIAAKGSAGLSIVAGPMGEALVATAIGLFVAIPAVMAYNAFARINRLIIQDLRHISEQLSIYLSYGNK